MIFRLIKNLVLIAVVVFFGYYFRVEIAGGYKLFKQLTGITKPCSETIYYSIGEFDTEFGLTEAQFIQASITAATLWEVPLRQSPSVEKNLLEYRADGDLKLNLIYDYRQQATAKLQQLGMVINNDKETYDALKAKHASLSATYRIKKAAFEQALATYEAHKKSYEDQVVYWNEQGGAPKDEFAKLEDARLQLNSEVASINQIQIELNELVSNLNATVSILNPLAKTLNLTVENYNTIGRSTGEEFDAGEYLSSHSGESITVYQFDNYAKLIRVLTHEFGHALGLDHLDNPKAIMYRLNAGDNGVLTADDIAALKKVCHID